MENKHLAATWRKMTYRDKATKIIELVNKRVHKATKVLKLISKFSTRLVSN